MDVNMKLTTLCLIILTTIVTGCSTILTSYQDQVNSTIILQCKLANLKAIPYNYTYTCGDKL